MYRLSLLLFLMTTLIACQHPDSTNQAVTTNWTDSLTTQLQTIQQEGQINGFGVAIVNSKGVLYQQGFGFADVKAAKPYTAQTIQNIASVSKTLIGLALEKAQELGQLKLDDPINNYLPFSVVNPGFPKQQITIRQLATHTSSITDTDDYGKNAYVVHQLKDTTIAANLRRSEKFNHPNTFLSLEDFLREMLTPGGKWYQKEVFLDRAPGDIYEYSNVGATLAAFIIERATQQSYRDFTQMHILKPLGMNHSSWSLDRAAMPQHTQLYYHPDSILPLYSLITYPDGGLITSIEDMSKYLVELIRGQAGQGTLLEANGYQEIFSRQLGEDNFLERDSSQAYDDEYNSGLFMGFTPNGHIGHMGGDPGVSTFLFFNPDTQIGRLLFVNTDLNPKSAKQFYAIWDQLGEFAPRFLE